MNGVKKLSFLVLLLQVVTITIVSAQHASSRKQEYLIFQQKKGFNRSWLAPRIDLSQNHVTVESPDSTFNIFNFYYAVDSVWVGPLNLSKDTKDLSIHNDVLVTAIIAVKKGQQIRMRKIEKRQLDTLATISYKELLDRFYAQIKQQTASPVVGMALNRALKHKLIVNLGEEFFLVDESIPLTAYLITSDEWFFPNEFKSGVLNVGWNAKQYALSDFNKMQPGSYMKRMYDRVYRSSTAPVNGDTEKGNRVMGYTFWEFLDPEANLMLGNRYYKNYHPGFGTFTLLPKIGFINCSMKPSLREKDMPTNISGQKLDRINQIPALEFIEAFRKRVYNIVRGGD